MILDIFFYDFYHVFENTMNFTHYKQEFIAKPFAVGMWIEKREVFIELTEGCFLGFSSLRSLLSIACQNSTKP